MRLHPVDWGDPPWIGSRQARGLDDLARAGAAFSTQTGTAASLARLFIIFAAAHFFLNPATLDEFTKATDGFLNRFFFSHVQLNHNDSAARKGCFEGISARELVNISFSLGICPQHFFKKWG